MIRFFWCHTDGCPNYGRARRMLVPACEYCGQEMKITAPGEDESDALD